MAVMRQGMNPTALSPSVGRLRGYATECDQVVTSATGAVNNLKGEWGGNDGAKFVSEWASAQGTIGSAAQRLREMATALERNIQAQDTASGGSSGVPIPPLGPVPPLTDHTSVGPSGSGTQDYSGNSVLNGIDTALQVKGAIPLALAGTAWGIAKSTGGNLSTLTAGALQYSDEFAAATRSGKTAGTLNAIADMMEYKGLSGAFAEGSRASSVVGRFGVLGPIGLGVSALQLGHAIAYGDTGDIVSSGVNTALAAGALFAPPPINIACGVGSLVMMIPGVSDFVGDVGEDVVGVVKDVGDAIADGASKAWDAITPW